MAIPTNDDSKTIEYETKFLISEPGRYPPLAWKVSKIAPSLNGDMSKFTMTQEQFDPSRDNADLMIANYYSSYVEPELPEIEEVPTFSDLEIVYSGQPAVRAGGGYKKFALKSRVNGELTDVTEDIEWSVDFSDGDSEKLQTSINGNIFKVKCLNDYSLIGKVFTITAKIKGGLKSIAVEVISL